MRARTTIYAAVLMLIIASLLGLGALAQPAPKLAKAPSDVVLSEVIPGPVWCDFYSNNSQYEGAAIPAGAVIDAYDPQGAHCGTFKVTTAGKWGYMHVYADDPETEEDEGAESGDTITFRINGCKATVDSGSATWVSQDKVEVGLSADCRPTATPTDTPTPTNTPTDTPTPTITPTPSDTPTPTDTPVVTDTPTPTNTNTPTITPTFTNTPEGRYIFGYVRNAANDAGLEGVVVRLYREENGNWQQLSEKTTDSNGHYAFGFSPVPKLHRIVETDPAGYMSDRVVLPAGFVGTVVNANTVEFEPPSEGSVGSLVFYDLLAPTQTPKPTNTPTATLTETPTLTPTTEVTSTPTDTAQVFRVWLPILVKS